jgi:hypothetical protein
MNGNLKIGFQGSLLNSVPPAYNNGPWQVNTTLLPKTAHGPEIPSLTGEARGVKARSERRPAGNRE